MLLIGERAKSLPSGPLLSAAALAGVERVRQESLVRDGQKRIVGRRLRLLRQQCAEDLKFAGELSLHVRPDVLVERQVLGLRFGETHLEMRAPVRPFAEGVGHEDLGRVRGR